MPPHASSSGALNICQKSNVVRYDAACLGARLYDYDFGSTTRLTVERTGARVGRIGKHLVRLLVRNDPVPWKCGICTPPATIVCCAHESDDSPFVCDAHEADHECGEESFLPVVNSPRMGVCGYAG
jgi:hypothetical protein